MDNLNWNSYYDNNKAEIMDESLLSSLDLHEFFWPHEMNAANHKEKDEIFLQHQEEFFASDQLLPLPLITTNSEDMQLIRNILNFSSSCESDKHHDFMTRHEDCYNPMKSKKAKVDLPKRASIDFGREGGEELDGEAVAQVKEMIYRAAALRPLSIGVEEIVEKPRRKNLRISNDPQTAAARHRRERISERLRVLQRLVPGGRKMDTASMLDEAANYLKFLKAQVTALEKSSHGIGSSSIGVNCCSGMLPFPVNLNHISSPMQTCMHPIPRQMQNGFKA